MKFNLIRRSLFTDLEQGEIEVDTIDKLMSFYQEGIEELVIRKDDEGNFMLVVYDYTD